MRVADKIDKDIRIIVETIYPDEINIKIHLQNIITGKNRKPTVYAISAKDFNVCSSLCKTPNAREKGIRGIAPKSEVIKMNIKKKIKKKKSKENNEIIAIPNLSGFACNIGFKQ